MKRIKWLAQRANQPSNYDWLQLRLPRSFTFVSLISHSYKTFYPSIHSLTSVPKFELPTPWPRTADNHTKCVDDHFPFWAMTP